MFKMPDDYRGDIGTAFRRRKLMLVYFSTVF
jgi:hypothetical protein